MMSGIKAALNSLRMELEKMDSWGEVEAAWEVSNQIFIQKRNLMEIKAGQGFKIGDRVEFYGKNDLKTGEIIRMSKTRATIEVINLLGEKEKWGLPFTMIRKVITDKKGLMEN